MSSSGQGYIRHDNAPWYKDAIIYHVDVRAFYDSDGDGTGDFLGLTERLDYLQDLGITAIWLAPFYPSSIKDGGYEISDCTNIHQAYGSLRDFKIFIREASHHGINVITELPLKGDSTTISKAMLRVFDLWLGLGVSGICLDGMSHSDNREDTGSKNLLKTQALIKELRTHIDERSDNRVLLANVDQRSEEAVASFGNGDECQMVCDFSLPPLMFMAISMEDRFPIVDVLEHTPPIPEMCQWALFLRNQNDLNLGMLSEEEQDYLYRGYASESEARFNNGIRRRLAPLLGNDQTKIELMNGILFSLAGTPIIYYGDEIGMGDNFYLDGLNGVRTPMQWSPAQNAGFSQANPQRLYLPLITDPKYHYEHVNVEAQQNNSDSLLRWMKNLTALRKRFKVLSRGSLEWIHPENRKVLAFIRRYHGEAILVAANLSSLAEDASLNLAEFSGSVPVEVFSNRKFPAIGEATYTLSLPPHGLYWLPLESKRR